MTHPDVTIVLPAISNDRVSTDLRHLTRLLVEGNHAEHVGGGLGGKHGYGADYTNDVFAMRHYYWGDCECDFDEAEGVWDRTHEHASFCYQQVIRQRGYLDYDSGVAYQKRQEINEKVVTQVCAEMGLDDVHGSAVHCTCTYDNEWKSWRAANDHAPACGIVAPNFLHKASGSEVRFYKYLGRGMNVDLHADWVTIFADVLASLPAGR